MKIFGIEAEEIVSEKIGLTEWRIKVGQYDCVIHKWKPKTCSYGEYHWHVTPPYPGKLIDGWKNSLEECVNIIQQTVIAYHSNKKWELQNKLDIFQTSNKVIEEYVASI